MKRPQSVTFTMPQLYLYVGITFFLSTFVFDVVIYHTALLLSMIHAAMVTLVSEILTGIYHVHIRK